MKIYSERAEATAILYLKSERQDAWNQAERTKAESAAV